MMYFELVSQIEFGHKFECPTYDHANALSELRKLLSVGSQKSLIVEISGDRWSGKTTLLRDFAITASTAGWLVAAGSAISPAQGVLFDAFIDALNELVDHHSIDLQRVLPHSHLRVLGSIFPSLATTSSDAFRADPQEMYKVFHVIRGLIKALSAFGDLVLLLDDMHRAHGVSISMLGYLLRHPLECPVVIAVGHRPRQADSTLLGLLSTGVANGAARRFVLGPLSRDSALALLPKTFNHRLCIALLGESGGNPGLLMGLASLQTVSGSSDFIYADLPRDVLTVCLREFRNLSELARRVGQAIAVLGESVELEALRHVAQVDDAEMWAAVDELADEDLISFDGSSGQLRFVNSLLRMAAYQSAGQGWLLSAHTRAVEVLASRQKSVSQIAAHVECVAAIDDESGARLLLAAAHKVMWRDPAQTARWIAAENLSAAMSITGQERYVLLGKALALAGQLAEASEVLEKVTDHVPCGSPVWAEIVCWRARVCFLNGRQDEAHRALDAALVALPPDDTQSAPQLRCTRLVFALDAGASPEQTDQIYLMRYLASMTGLEAAHAAGVLAAAASRQSGMPADHYAAVAAKSFDGSADNEVAQHLEGLYWLARAEGLLGCYDAAFQHCRRGLRLAEERGMGGMVPKFASALGSLQLKVGDLNGAKRHAALACTAAAATGSDHLLTTATALKERISGTELEIAERPAGKSRTGRPVPQGRNNRVLTVNPVADREPDIDQAATIRLSGRETEIAFLVSYGKTNQQIARLLGLSHKTVETYLARIFNKLTVSCRAEVAAIISRAGILPPHSPALSACLVRRSAGCD